MKADTRERRLERLLGRRVRARDGSPIGRIEEICAEQRGDAFEVMEYHLGSGAMLERLGLARILGRKPPTYIVRWDQMSLDDPEEPRLTCDVSEIHKKRR